MGCAFMETDDPYDCVFTTTESPTSTEEVGCCMGDSYKTNAMCNNRLTRQQCDRSSSCNFVEGGVLDEGDCDFGTTQPPDEPGCCYGNPDIAYSARWMEQCKDYGTERECLMLEDGDGNKRCTFEPMNEYMDCEAVWPTTTESPTEPAGCCKGSSYKAQAKCLGLADQKSCERKSCEWIVTMIPDDCIVTTTETPTTTVTPGCCKGTSRTSNDACNAIEDPDQCDRRSSCTFIAFGLIDEDCVFPPTEPPSEPGCCYGNPDIAYSKRWMEECKKFGTEEECLMLTNDDGEPRCFFEPLGEYEDCETVWPTTTTTTIAPGCCKGSSYKQNDKCRGFDNDQAQCERKGCEFIETDDFSDCDITTTETPTTTVTPGCCKG